MGVTAQPLRKRRSRPAAIFPNVAFQRFRLPLGRVRHEAGCNAEEPFSEDTRAASPGPWRTKVPSDEVFRAILFYFVTSRPG